MDIFKVEPKLYQRIILADILYVELCIHIFGPPVYMSTVAGRAQSVQQRVGLYS
jgi:hypothetical protein